MPADLLKWLNSKESNINNKTTKPSLDSRFYRISRDERND